MRLMRKFGARNVHRVTDEENAGGERIKGDITDWKKVLQQSVSQWGREDAGHTTLE